MVTSRDLDLPPDVAGYLDDLVAATSTLPEPATAERHHAAIVALAADIATTSGRAPSRWATVVRRAAALGVAKTLLVGSAALAAGGAGLAATGNLPDGVQARVADAAQRIGIDLPRPAHAREVVRRTPAGGAEPPGQTDGGPPGLRGELPPGQQGADRAEGGRRTGQPTDLPGDRGRDDATGTDEVGEPDTDASTPDSGADAVVPTPEPSVTTSPTPTASPTTTTSPSVDEPTARPDGGPPTPPSQPSPPSGQPG